MNDTTFSCSHFYSHTFLSAGKQSEMSQRSQVISSPESTTAKARACCLVSRQCVSVGEVYSSNPQSPRSTRDSQVWPWEERHEKSGWCSVQHASGNREYTRKIVQNMKNRLRLDEISSGISMTSWEDAHFYMDEIYGFIDAGSIAHGPELRKEFGFFQEFWIWEHQRLVRDYKNDEGNSETKNVFPTDVALLTRNSTNTLSHAHTSRRLGLQESGPKVWIHRT